MGPKVKKNLPKSNDESQLKRKTTNTEKSKKACKAKTLFPGSVLYEFHRNVSNNCVFHLNDRLKKSVIMSQIKRFKAYKTLSPFERRVTSMAWHPVYQEFFVAGSKGGELILHRMNESDDYFHPGIGAGGSVVGLKFDLEDPFTVYTASITGNLRKEDFHGIHSQTLLSTLSWENWFSSLDICYKRNVLLSGDCTGYGYLLEASGVKIWNKKPRLHSSKITHCEFNQHDENIFVTSSVDHSVKLWDLRMVAEENVKETSKCRPLREYKFERAISAAYFSPSNGYNLLTTDQHSQIRIYSTPCWDESLVITHPHRHFQHMTPIKANWHPLEDIFIVGRYPDKNIQAEDFRSIDFYNSSDGNLLHRIMSPSEKIVSLNAVNISGTVLASAAGFGVVFLKDENIIQGVSCYHKSDHSETERDDSDDHPKKPQMPKKKPKRPSKDQRIASKKLKNMAL